eukprot:1334559-Prymnesium_polylepis.2
MNHRGEVRPEYRTALRYVYVFGRNLGLGSRVSGVPSVVLVLSRRSVSGCTTHLAHVICSPGPGEQYLPAKRLAIRRLTASVPVA